MQTLPAYANINFRNVFLYHILKTLLYVLKALTCFVYIMNGSSANAIAGVFLGASQYLNAAIRHSSAHHSCYL